MERFLHILLELALVPAGVLAIATLEPGCHFREQFHSHDSPSRGHYSLARESTSSSARRAGAVRSRPADTCGVSTTDSEPGGPRFGTVPPASSPSIPPARKRAVLSCTPKVSGVTDGTRSGGLSGSAMSISLLRLRSARAFSASDRGSKDFGLAMARPPLFRRFCTSGLGGSMPARCERSAPLVWRYSHTYMSLRRMLEEVRVSRSLLPAHRRRRARPTKGRR